MIDVSEENEDLRNQLKQSRQEELISKSKEVERLEQIVYEANIEAEEAQIGTGADPEKVRLSSSEPPFF